MNYEEKIYLSEFGGRLRHTLWNHVTDLTFNLNIFFLFIFDLGQIN